MSSDASQRHAGLQRTQARRLDRRPVRHRIGKWHADFDEIGAGLRQPGKDARVGRRIGIAGGKIGHEPGAILTPKLREPLRDSRHSFIPCRAATVSMSLSPRPDKLTTTRLSLASVGASFFA